MGQDGWAHGALRGMRAEVARAGEPPWRTGRGGWVAGPQSSAARGLLATPCAHVQRGPLLLHNLNWQEGFLTDHVLCGLVKWGCVPGVWPTSCVSAGPWPVGELFRAKGPGHLLTLDTVTPPLLAALRGSTGVHSVQLSCNKLVSLLTLTS